MAMRPEISSMALKAAEVGSTVGQPVKKHTSGAKALIDLIAVAARLKSCPDTIKVKQLSTRSAVAVECFRALSRKQPLQKAGLCRLGRIVAGLFCVDLPGSGGNAPGVKL